MIHSFKAPLSCIHRIVHYHYNRTLEHFSPSQKQLTPISLLWALSKSFSVSMESPHYISYKRKHTMNGVLWLDSFTRILSKFRQVVACLSTSFLFTANGNQFHLSTIMKNAVRSISFHKDECFHFSQVEKELLCTMVTPSLLFWVVAKLFSK